MNSNKIVLNHTYRLPFIIFTILSLFLILVDAKRGDVVGFKLIEEKSIGDLQPLMEHIAYEAITDLEYEIYDKTLSQNVNDIQHYKLIYNTIDPLGNEIISTATLIVPFVYKADTLLYNMEDDYGTSVSSLEDQKFCTLENYKLYSCTLNKDGTNSCCNYDTNIVTRLLMYATSGFAVIAPDNLGLSKNYPVASGLKAPPFSQTRVLESVNIDVSKEIKQK